MGYKSNAVKKLQRFIAYLILLYIYLHKLRVIINTSIMHNIRITVFLFVIGFSIQYFVIDVFKPAGFSKSRFSVEEKEKREKEKRIKRYKNNLSHPIDVSRQLGVIFIARVKVIFYLQKFLI